MFLRGFTRAPELVKRRTLLAASGAWLVLYAAGSAAQPGQAPRRIAVLIPGSATGYRSRLAAFRSELTRLGYAEGRDIVVEPRFAEDRIERLPQLAAELVALGPAVIVTAASAAIAACKKATSTIPIVFATGGSPVEQGFVASLRRPGGNITGVMTRSELVGKVVEIAREALPRAQRIAILVQDTDPAHRSMLDIFASATKRAKFEAAVVRVARKDDLERAFREISNGRADVLVGASLSFIASNYREIADRALKARVPLFSTNIEETATGGVLGYGTSREENFRRAATLVDKILRGANPGELPIDQPERVQLIVNLRTAKAIGITLSPVTMLRADRVIE